jgi:MoxR-like ATPase
MVRAAKGFGLVAAMNPFDAVGTARISGAVYDRVCRVAMSYQSADDERDIVMRAIKDVEGAPSLEWVTKAVQAVRTTRQHQDLRIGSSVRGAIDAALVAASLAKVRSTSAADGRVGLDAALVALSGRVRVREGSTRTSDEVIEEIWTSTFAEGDAKKVTAPAGAKA